MQLGNILDTAKHPIATRTVKFTVLGTLPDGRQTMAQAEAALSFVSEAERHEANRRAYEYLIQKAKDRPISDEDIRQEKDYWLLMAALRDKEDLTRQFCFDADYPRFRAALIQRQVAWLKEQYERFIEDEFPELASPEQMAELKAEARAK